MPYCVEGTVLSSPHSLFCLIFPKAFLFVPLDLLSTLPTCPVPWKDALWCTAVLSTWLLASGFCLSLANGEYCQEISGHRHLFPWIPIRSLQAKCILSWSPQILLDTHSSSCQLWVPLGACFHPSHLQLEVVSAPHYA